MSKREEKPTRKRKLTAAEKKKIRAIMERARGDGKPHTAQDTLPFRQMYPDGLCKLDDNTQMGGNFAAHLNSSGITPVFPAFPGPG